MKRGVRVRYAPSPTGNPHLGNVRTAIYNWLFARNSGGSFIIRIEDTDQTRKAEGATEAILDALLWLGLDWDEGPCEGGAYGPYYQSQRLDMYRIVAEDLIQLGKAYWCYCSRDRLAEIREKQTIRKSTNRYDRRCRNLSSLERKTQQTTDTQPVIRFAMPLHGVTKVNDRIRGVISFENEVIDDFVILKSDGYPTYHLANVVDDHAMNITSVLRADEWISSSPRHILLYDALGWEPPELAHLPMILAPDRSKLSKRHGATSVLDYRELGYLPEAMLNFLVLLGWSYDDKTETFTISELINNFSLERVSKGGAIFNLDKLNWLNGYYIRELTHERLANALREFWTRYPPCEFHETPDNVYLLKIVPIIQKRLKTLRDAAPLIAFFFNDNVEYEASELVQHGADVEDTVVALRETFNKLEKMTSFDAESLGVQLRLLAKDLGLKIKLLLGPVRVAITGENVSPPLFETMEILGRDRTLEAIKNAINKL